MVGTYFQINDWVLSVDENKLYRQDREVSAEPRLINLLRFLAEHAGEVFCREALITHVWDGAIVTDQVVTQSIFELRKLLRDGRKENLSYVVTVPKRGYKLVADVQLLDSAPLPVNLPSEQSRPDDDDNDMAFPAAPLTRAVFSLSARTVRSARAPSLSRWRQTALNVLWVSVLIVAMGLFTYNQSGVRITQAIDTHLIEFRFQEQLHHTTLSHELADGFSQKLMSDIAQVSTYRVMLHKAVFNSGILPGKTVTVRVKDDSGVQLLDIEYKNNSSENVLFSRQYPLVSQRLQAVMQQASLDLMQALTIAHPYHKAARLMADMPKNTTALQRFVQANHYLNVSEATEFARGVELLEQTLDAEPGNAYVEAELLVAYYVQHALEPERTLNHERIAILSRQLTQAVATEPLPTQPRVYEALALHEVMSGQLSQANRDLNRALAQRDSVLAYVIQGKLAELNGELDKAGESYSEAFYIDTSMETYLLCQNLMFSSDLKAIDYAMYRSVHPAVVRVI